MRCDVDLPRLLGTHDGSVVLLDLDRGEELDRFSLGTSLDRVESVAFAPDGKSVALGTARGVVLQLALR
jgi:hypothetical protein